MDRITGAQADPDWGIDKEDQDEAIAEANDMRLRKEAFENEQRRLSTEPFVQMPDQGLGERAVALLGVEGLKGHERIVGPNGWQVREIFVEQPDDANQKETRRIRMARNVDDNKGLGDGTEWLIVSTLPTDGGVALTYSTIPENPAKIATRDGTYATKRGHQITATLREELIVTGNHEIGAAERGRWGPTKPMSTDTRLAPFTETDVATLNTALEQAAADVATVMVKPE
jgi:hypothetical protein